jgi:subtilisin family serine protease
VRRPRLRARLSAAATLLIALAFAAGPVAPAGASSSHDCDSVGITCFDALPADSAWASAIKLPDVPNRWKGDGVTVASIDTGRDPERRPRRPPPRPRGLHGRPRRARPLRPRHAHGRLIAGDGTTSDEAFEGAAPEANLVSVKVASWDGATDASTVIAALQWVVSNRARYGIRVVNLSWGTDGVQPADADPLDAAVERAWRAGLVVVVSAGNAGPTPGR